MKLDWVRVAEWSVPGESVGEGAGIWEAGDYEVVSVRIRRGREWVILYDAWYRPIIGGMRFQPGVLINRSGQGFETVIEAKRACEVYKEWLESEQRVKDQGMSCVDLWERVEARLARASTGVGSRRF